MTDAVQQTSPAMFEACLATMGKFCVEVEPLL